MLNFAVLGEGERGGGERGTAQVLLAAVRVHSHRGWWCDEFSRSRSPSDSAPELVFFFGQSNPLDCRRVVHSARLHGPSGVDIHPVVPSPSQNQQHQQHQHSATMLAQDCHTNEVCVQSWLNVSFLFSSESELDDVSSGEYFAPAVSYAAPAPSRKYKKSSNEYLAPAPAVSSAASAPTGNYIARAPAGYAAPAPAVDHASVPAVYAVSAPGVEYIALAQADPDVPSPVVEHIAPAPAMNGLAPVVEYMALALSVKRLSPCRRIHCAVSDFNASCVVSTCSEWSTSSKCASRFHGSSHLEFPSS